MLADPLLTEHYAKAGLKAVLIDQQHGLSLIQFSLQQQFGQSLTWFMCMAHRWVELHLGVFSVSNRNFLCKYVVVCISKRWLTSSYWSGLSTVYDILHIHYTFAQVSWTSELHLSVFSDLRSSQLVFQLFGLQTTHQHSSGQAWFYQIGIAWTGSKCWSCMNATRPSDLVVNFSFS